MDVDSLRKSLAQNGQEHLLKHWDQLTDSDKKSLYSDLSSINYKEVNEFFHAATESLDDVSEKLDVCMSPIPDDVFGSVRTSTPSEIEEYETQGMKQISEGRVAVVLLAGGQGTRLGVSYPKGMYDVGLPSGKSLYQIQAERIVKLQQLASEKHGKPGNIPWYIMTSKPTKEPTKAFFEKNKYFGLDEKNVTFFQQCTLPCFTFDGKIVLESPCKIAQAPDGNGGLYRALRVGGVLEDMQQRRVKFVHVYCVDNILVKMADPVFMGFCISKEAECGNKVVEKVMPTEPVGVVCLVNGVYQVVEYSEITSQTAEKRTADGRLLFSSGNIANHFFTMDFLKAVVNEKESMLKHHVAKKKIPYCDGDGQTVKPTTPNGIKMEKFVFDVFQFANHFAVWEALRNDEFSPLKNADSASKDTPTTARQDLFSLNHRRIEASGGKLVKEDGTPIPAAVCDGKSVILEPPTCEISPLVSYAGEGLKEKVAGKQFVPPFLLAVDGETSFTSNLKQFA
ncbi:PREDICTED: UDP-N-acetylhexosamine pyrophosphorylase-like [Priapulus caudatus]|uniref:UDP-N-acetylglucosamine diphosphorylase n=1 Tax=Priapulus caudatus TaxID=37621 RepID=A0ABM1EZN9_PRICU|nr:PREDICTED: UDP-N-acetylhexosamine pyrophosphorylase-like [Priapulus caudatus]